MNVRIETKIGEIFACSTQKCVCIDESTKF